MDTLLHAMMWFYEACREKVDMIATMKYAASLDSLACGEGEEGIKKLVKARLGIEDQSIYTRIKGIYEIRSRSVHGNGEETTYDLSGSRRFAEALARFCLIVCIDMVAQYPDLQDTKQFSSQPLQDDRREHVT